MPVAVSYPGVYIQEAPSAVHTITGVATSIAAFVGWANQGPTTPQLVLSFSDFQRTFGGLYQGAALGYAVSQFFGNGGSQAYIIRLTDGTAAAAATTSVPAGTASIVFSAATMGVANPGAWGKNYGVLIKNQTVPTGAPPTGRFRVQVVYNPPGATTPTVVESFENLSMNTPDTQGRYLVDIPNALSNFVTATVTTPMAAPATTPADTATPLMLLNGADGALLTPNSAAFETALASTTSGYAQLAHVDLFNLLCVPGETTPATISNLESFCVTHRAFMIVDAASTDTFASLQGASGPNSNITGTPGTNAAF